MKSIIQFHVFKGDDYYTAEGVDLAIITQGETLDELAENIREAVSLHLEGEDFSALNLTEKPSVLLNIELAPLVYA